MYGRCRVDVRLMWGQCRVDGSWMENIYNKVRRREIIKLRGNIKILV